MGKFTQRSTAPQLSGCRWGVVVFQHRNAFKLNTYKILFPQFASCTFHFFVQSLSHVRLFSHPMATAHQAALSFTISQSLLKLISIELVVPSNHLLLCRPLLFLPSIFLGIRSYNGENLQDHLA